MIQTLASLILQNPTLDNAGILALASVPILTPRLERVTFTTLSAFDVWGYAKTQAFETALQASGQASLLLSILGGNGLAASDPQAAAMSGAFVALSGGAITIADTVTALNTVTYPCGTIPTLADIAAARAQIAVDAQAAADLKAAKDEAAADQAIADAAALVIATQWAALADSARKQSLKIAALQAAGSPPPANLIAVIALPDPVVPPPADRNAAIANLDAANSARYNAGSKYLGECIKDPTKVLPVSLMGLDGVA